MPVSTRGRVHLRVLEQVTLTPVRRHRGQPARVLTHYGIHDATGRKIKTHPVLMSLDTTYAYQSRRPPSDARPLPGAHIYGGLIFGWFGHFITESLPNLLAVARAKKTYPDLPILAHSHNQIDPVAWKARHDHHLKYFFGKLGLDVDDLHFVTEPVIADTLIMPPAPFAQKFRYSDWIVDDIDRIWGRPSDGIKHYLSRTRVQGSPRVVDEPRIEAIFAEHGYEAAHLQELDLDAQLRLVAGSDALAGPQGTALHWSLYGANCQSVLSLGFRSWLQKGICTVRGQTYVELRGKRPRGGTYRLRTIDEAALHKALATL